MTFLEDLQRSEKRAEQLQNQLDEQQKVYAAFVGVKKDVDQKLLRVETALEEARRDVEARNLTISSLRSQVDRIPALEESANRDASRVLTLEGELAKTVEERDLARKEASDLSDELRDVKQLLAEREKNIDRAETLLGHFKARAEASAAIAAL